MPRFYFFTFGSRLCIKVGRRQGDACVGTWDLGTRDVKYRDAGDVNDYC